jgi:predicted N-acetyltransferase YhbS
VLTQSGRVSAGSRSPSISIFPSARLGSVPAAGAGQSLHDGAMTSPTYRIRPAVPGDIPVILGLIGSAATWLQRFKDTDQWKRPWPTEDERNARIARGVARGSTWVVEENGVLVATITYRDQGNPKLWTQAERSEPAVYVSRLIVSREQAGRGLGAAMIDWAGLRGAEEWHAQSVRVDVWTTNLALHDYYKGQKFEHLRTLEFEDPWEYPSAALFQKPIDAIDGAAAERFEMGVSTNDEVR